MNDVVFKCNKCKIYAEAEFVYDDLIHVWCSNCPADVRGSCAVRMFREERIYRRDISIYNVLERTLGSSNSQFNYQSAPKPVKPNWEFFTIFPD